MTSPHPPPRRWDDVVRMLDDSSAPPPEDGIYLGVEEDLYHSWPIPSFSSLKMIADQPPAVYLVQQWIPRASTALDIGAAVDAAWTRGIDHLVDHYVTPPLLTGKTRWATTKEGRAWAADQRALGRRVIAHEDAAHIMGMVAALERHPLASTIREAAYRQVAWIATESDTGLRIRGLMDLVCPPGTLLPDRGVIADLKTARDASPRAFMRSAAGLHYGWQASMYSWAMRELVGGDWEWLWIVVDKTPPHCVWVYRPPSDALEAAEAAWREALWLLHDAQEQGEWVSSLTMDEPWELDWPRWAMGR